MNGQTDSKKPPLYRAKSLQKNEPHNCISCDNLKNLNNELIKRLQDVNIQNSELKQNLNVANGQIDTWMEKYNEARHEVNHKTNELELITIDNKETYSKWDEIKKENVILKSSENELITQSIELNKRTDSLNNEINYLNLSLDEKTKSNEELAEKIKILNQDIEEKCAAIEESKENIASLLDQLNKINIQLNESDSKNKALALKMSEMEKDSKKSKLNEKTILIDELKQELFDKSNFIQSLSSELDQKNNLLNDSNLKIEESSKFIESITNESAERLAKVCQLEKQVLELSEKLEKSMTQIDLYNKENTVLMNHLNVQSTQLDSLNVQNEEIRSQLNQKLSDYQNLKAKYENQSEIEKDLKIQELNELIHDLKNEVNDREIIIFNHERELKLLRFRLFKMDLQYEPTLLDTNELSQIVFEEDCEAEIANILSEQKQLKELDEPFLQQNDNVVNKHDQSEILVNEDINYLIESNSNYRFELEMINKKISELVQNNEILQKNEDTLKSQINELNDKLLNSEIEINLFNEQFVVNKNKLAQVEADYKVELERNQAFNQQIEKIQTELLQNQAISLSFSNQVNELSCKNGDLHNKLSENESEMRKVSNELNARREKLVDYERRLINLENENEKLKIDSEKNQMLNFDLEKEIQAFKSNEIELTDQINKLDEKLNEMKEKFNIDDQSSCQKIEILTRKNIELETKSEKNSSEIILLQRKLCNTLIDKENLVKDLLEMNDKYEKNRSNNQQLDILEKKIAKKELEHKAELDKLRTKLSMQINKLLQSGDDLIMDQIDKQIDINIHQKLDILIEDINKFLTQINDLKLENSNLKAELNANSEDSIKEIYEQHKNQLLKQKKIITKQMKEIEDLKKRISFLSQHVESLNRQIFEFDDKNKNKENKDSDLIDKVQKQDKFSPNTNSSMNGKPLANSVLQNQANNSSASNNPNAPNSSSSVKKQNQCAQQ